MGWGRWCGGEKSAEDHRLQSCMGKSEGERERKKRGERERDSGHAFLVSDVERERERGRRRTTKMVVSDSNFRLII